MSQSIFMIRSLMAICWSQTKIQIDLSWILLTALGAAISPAGSPSRNPVLYCCISVIYINISASVEKFLEIFRKREECSMYSFRKKLCKTSFPKKSKKIWPEKLENWKTDILVSSGGWIHEERVSDYLNEKVHQNIKKSTETT